jgi:hypothetical protein
MKNLINRVYIKHDNNITPSSYQSRIIVTDREMRYPISEEREVLDKVFIKHYVKSLDELDTLYGDREGFWSAMLLSTEKLLIIASPAFTAELLIQYWKSVFKDPSRSFIKLMYDLFTAQENLLGCREKERQISKEDVNVIDRKCVPVSDDLFNALFDKVEHSQIVSEAPVTKLPFEYLLIGHLTKSGGKGLNTEFYRRASSIVLLNIVRAIVNAKEDFFSETHNYYLLDDETSLGELRTNPIGYLSKHKRLAWVVDEEFVYGNEDVILKKYSLDKLKDIFKVYTTLFKFEYDEEKALDFIIAKDYAGMIRYDIADQKGNFFGADSFTAKINGLLISHLYELVRNSKAQELDCFSLK